MVSIISGRFKGRKLHTASGPGYRPATARVRESLFSTLQSMGVDWSGLRVLDLFAGSGALALEALSRGVPAVASDVGGVREWCLDGETGFVVPPKDAAAIADRTRHLLADDGRLRAFGRRGLGKIRERFTPEGHVDRLQGIYERACSKELSSTSVHG